MRVEGTKQAAYRKTGAASYNELPASDTPDCESRALVVHGSDFAPAAKREPGANYRQPAFLAHLIATKEQHPQTRERRRAEPGDAIAAYRAVDALVS
ncbi:MAG: hypothetical protein WAM62_00515 [Pseudolabrys sp.]|jgi:hypothetical protein